MAAGETFSAAPRTGQRTAFVSDTKPIAKIPVRPPLVSRESSVEPRGSRATASSKPHNNSLLTQTGAINALLFLGMRLLIPGRTAHDGDSQVEHRDMQTNTQ